MLSKCKTLPKISLDLASTKMFFVWVLAPVTVSKPFGLLSGEAHTPVSKTSKIQRYSKKDAKL